MEKLNLLFIVYFDKCGIGDLISCVIIDME